MKQMKVFTEVYTTNLGLETKLCLVTIESIFQKYVFFSFLYFIRVSFALNFVCKVFTITCAVQRTTKIEH